MDEISPGVFVAVGGCGKAAKCCDEIGRAAAVLVNGGEWDEDIRDARVIEPTGKRPSRDIARTGVAGRFKYKELDIRFRF